MSPPGRTGQGLFRRDPHQFSRDNPWPDRGRETMQAFSWYWTDSGPIRRPPAARNENRVFIGGAFGYTHRWSTRLHVVQGVHPLGPNLGVQGNRLRRS